MIASTSGEGSIVASPCCLSLTDTLTAGLNYISHNAPASFNRMLSVSKVRRFGSRSQYRASSAASQPQSSQSRANASVEDYQKHILY